MQMVFGSSLTMRAFFIVTMYLFIYCWWIVSNHWPNCLRFWWSNEYVCEKSREKEDILNHIRQWWCGTYHLCWTRFLLLLDKCLLFLSLSLFSSIFSRQIFMFFFVNYICHKFELPNICFRISALILMDVLKIDWTFLLFGRELFYGKVRIFVHLICKIFVNTYYIWIWKKKFFTMYNVNTGSKHVFF